jgi:DNA-binding transcriptional ArsR family regulator
VIRLLGCIVAESGGPGKTAGQVNISIFLEMWLTSILRLDISIVMEMLKSKLRTDVAVNALAALAHETRLGIFRLLVERGPPGLAAGFLAERLGLPASSLTFHVQHLHRAGLVTQRRAGRNLIYAADFGAMRGLVDYLTENCCAGSAFTAAACAPAPTDGETADETAARACCG